MQELITKASNSAELLVSDLLEALKAAEECEMSVVSEIDELRAAAMRLCRRISVVDGLLTEGKIKA